MRGSYLDTVRRWRACVKPNLWVVDNLAKFHAPDPDVMPKQSVSFSQCGEDRLIECRIRALAGEIDYSDIAYVDIGGGHPIANSNTWLFYKTGARGLVAEANPEIGQLQAELRPKDEIYLRPVSVVGNQTVTFFRTNHMEVAGLNREFIDAFVKSKAKDDEEWQMVDELSMVSISINDILKAAPKGQRFQILSIDVEGDDHDLLEAADFSIWQPHFIIVEHADGVVGEENGSIRLTALLKQKGYVPLVRTEINIIFERPQSN